MRTRIIPAALAVAAFVAAASVGDAAAAQTVDCYADYKAKQDSPLKLHYGVIALNGACTRQAASAEISQRIAREGWTLLNVLSVFDQSGLEQRKISAGKYYLRF